MKIAVVGLGVAGSYLVNRLSNEYEVVGFEMQPHDKFNAICAWGSSKNELNRIYRRVDIDFEDYVLFDGRTMRVSLDGDEREIKLIGLCTYDKHGLEMDLASRADVRYGTKATTETLAEEKYDLIIDATGMHRTLLPKVSDDLLIQCVEYRIEYDDPPHKDFYIRAFKNTTGYFWYFPLEENQAYVGAGDFMKNHNKVIEEFIAGNGGRIIRKIGRPIRIKPPRDCLPFTQGNVVGVGESIGTVFPMFGEGIIPSLQCAELLYENLHDLEAYREEVQKKFEYFNGIYDAILDKWRDRKILVKHAPALWKTYRAMKKQEKRFGLKVKLSDLIAIAKF